MSLSSLKTLIEEKLSEFDRRVADILVRCDESKVTSRAPSSPSELKMGEMMNVGDTLTNKSSSGTTYTARLEANGSFCFYTNNSTVADWCSPSTGTAVLSPPPVLTLGNDGTLSIKSGSTVIYEIKRPGVGTKYALTLDSGGNLGITQSIGNPIIDQAIFKYTVIFYATPCPKGFWKCRSDYQCYECPVKDVGTGGCTSPCWYICYDRGGCAE